MSLPQINQEHSNNCNHKCCRITRKIIKKIHALMRIIGANSKNHPKAQRMKKTMEEKNKECRQLGRKILRSGKEVL